MNQKNKNIHSVSIPNNNTTDIRKHWGQMGRSLLNGMIGDYLERENNPLAIKMGFYYRYNRITLNEYLAQQLDFPLTNKVVVFVHGLTDMESVWDFPPPKDQLPESFVGHYIEACFKATKSTNPENYGKKLQGEFGYTPFYLRYNTGISAERNGRDLATLLTKLVKNYPTEIDELMLVGFNMGGAVLNHAQSNGKLFNSPWLKPLSKCVYLGKPTEDSQLERFTYYTRQVMRLVASHRIDQSSAWLENKSVTLKTLANKLKLNNTAASLPKHPKRTSGTRNYYVHAGTNHSQKIDFSLMPEGSQNVCFESLTQLPLAHSEQVYGQVAKWVDQDERRQNNGKPIKPRALIPARREARPKQNLLPVIDNATIKVNRPFLAGAIGVMANRYDKALESIETFHYSLSEEPFYILQKYPVLSQISHPIEKTHHNLLNLFYRSLRSGGRWAHKMANTMASEDRVSECKA